MNSIMLIAVLYALYMLVTGPRIAGFVLLLLLVPLWLIIAFVGVLV